MKRFIIITAFSLIVISVYAQVKSEVSYDSKSKQITLIVTNMFDSKIILSPPAPGFDSNACWYKVTWKDARQQIISSYEGYIYGDSMGCYMPAKSTRTFYINMKNENKRVNKIEVLFHIEARVRGDKTYFTWKDQEFIKVYAY